MREDTRRVSEIREAENRARLYIAETCQRKKVCIDKQEQLLQAFAFGVCILVFLTALVI